MSNAGAPIPVTEAKPVEKKRIPHIKEIAWSARQQLMPGKLTDDQANAVEVAFKALIDTDREIPVKIGTIEEAAKVIRSFYFKGSMGTQLAEKLVAALRIICELGKTAPSKFGNKLDALVAPKDACKADMIGNDLTEEATDTIGAAVCRLVVGHISAPHKEDPKKAAKKAEKAAKKK